MVAKTIRMEARKEIEAFSESLNKIFMLLKIMRRDGKNIEDGKCIQDINGR